MTNEELRQRLMTLYEECMILWHDNANIPTIAEHLIANGVTIRDRGEWICKGKSPFPQYEPDEYCCSNCGCIKNFDYNFCPDCGADLRGEKDE